MEQEVKLPQVLDFFRNNSYEVKVYENNGRCLIDIWSETYKKYIIKDANEFQILKFYNNQIR
jgi:hypothetical protein